MSRPVKLNGKNVASALSKLPTWKVKNGKLHREYKFIDFVTAFAHDFDDAPQRFAAAR